RVLSAGDAQYPIGNKTELAEVGIKSTVDLPDIGHPMQDQPIFPNHFTINTNDAMDDLPRNHTLFDAAFQQWTSNKTEPFCDTLATGAGLLRLPDTSSFSEDVLDSSAG
ncbi:hypothetical protein PHLGIDRAFT_39380, partial [Phlebiopsis gigantea 11061_1 CR5-6]